MKKSPSFTLVEVLVVLIIIGILAAIAIPIYQNSVAKAEMDVAAADLQQAFANFRIRQMKLTYLDNSFAVKLCKIEYNDSTDLKYLLNVFCNDNVYAAPIPNSTNPNEYPADGSVCASDKEWQTNTGKTVKAAENSTLSNVSWNAITTGDQYANTPIVAECAPGATFDGTDGKIEKAHNYKGTTVGMFVLRDGTVRTIDTAGNKATWPW